MENSDEETHQREDLKQKKKKKRAKANNRVKPQLTPFVLAMQRGAQEFLKNKHHFTHRRRGSDTSVLSNASARSIHFSLDRNSSVDALSLTSMRPSSSNSVVQPKSEPKGKRITNFAIFTASSLLPGSVGDSENPDVVNLAMEELSKNSVPCSQCGGQGTYPPEIAIFNIEDDTSSTSSSSC